jgi:hypothetical protein
MVEYSKGCDTKNSYISSANTNSSYGNTSNTVIGLVMEIQNGTIEATLVSGQGTNYLYTLNYLSLTPVVSSGPQADPISQD